MNEITRTTKYEGTAAPKTPYLSNEDARQLKTALIAGDDPMAKRSDLVAMHKRLVEMNTTLGQGLNEAMAKQADATRKSVDGRIGNLEKSVNSIEGALRIELAPLLDRMVAEAVEARTPPARRPVRTTLAAVALIVVGVAIGTQFHDTVRSTATATGSYVAETASALVASASRGTTSETGALNLD